MISPITAHRRSLLGSALGLLALASPLSGLSAESSAPPAPPAAPAASEVQFMRDIAPILVQNCFACHGPKEPERDLRLDIYESMTQGDHPAVAAGEPEHSEIIKLITEEDSSSRMPRGEAPLTPAQIDLIRRWILAGAKFDGPDPKTPYATKPDAPKAPAAAPHPVRPPAAPAEPEKKDDSKAGASEPKKEKP
jgi:mono/diheme cytochrome c family protein